MHCFCKNILFFFFFLRSLDCQLWASGTINSFLKSVFISRETQKKLLTQWFDAAKTGNVEVMQNLIGKVDINALSSKPGPPRTALLWATTRGHANIVKLLLQVPGINVNLLNESGQTALMIAAQQGYENIVKLLLQIPAVGAGAINAQDILGYTALMRASCNGHANVVKILLHTRGIKINIRNTQTISQVSALSMAIECNYPAVEKLIKDRINELISETITLKDLGRLKEIVAQLMPLNIDNIIDEHALLDKAFAANCSEIIFYLLQNSDDPRKALSRFPFEQINPTSELFEYFVDLAYCNKPKAKPKSKCCQSCSKRAINILQKILFWKS